MSARRSLLPFTHLGPPPMRPGGELLALQPPAGDATSPEQAMAQAEGEVVLGVDVPAPAGAV